MDALIRFQLDVATQQQQQLEEQAKMRCQQLPLSLGRQSATCTFCFAMIRKVVEYSRMSLPCIRAGMPRAA